MARTTFSGPVYSGNPDNINDNTSGSTAYGFYTRVEIGSATGTSFGSSSYQTPGEAYGVFGRTQGGAPFSTTPTTTFNHVAGVAGNFAVIGTYANNGLMAGVLGIVNTNTLSGDAAVMAFMAGDAGTTLCRAAFGVAMAQTTAASGFTYGLDLKMQDIIADGGGPSGVQPYKTAEIRLADDGASAPVVIKVGNFTDGAASGVGKGSLGIDSTDGLLFVSDSAGLWQQVTV